VVHDSIKTEFCFDWVCYNTPQRLWKECGGLIKLYISRRCVYFHLQNRLDSSQNTTIFEEMVVTIIKTSQA